MDKVATARVSHSHLRDGASVSRETGWRGSINSVLMRDTTSSVLMRSFNNTSRYHYQIYSFTHSSIENHSSSVTRCVKCSIVMILLQQMCALWLSLWWIPRHLRKLIKVFTHKWVDIGDTTHKIRRISKVMFIGSQCTLKNQHLQFWDKIITLLIIK